MISPGHSPNDIQSHLYQAFLHASTTDVSLNVSAKSWSAIYRVHRVIIIQAGFFRDLFTGGFAESSVPGNRSSDQIDIIFDDENITRAAFELCIARLYGGGPPLHLSTSLIPTTTYPLTPSCTSTAIHDKLPPGHHPATPRFLLSLLATAIYLSIPALVSHALNSILGSIGPFTALEYLNFARGQPIADTSDEDEPISAVGLETLAQLTPQPSLLQSTKGDSDSDGSNSFTDKTSSPGQDDQDFVDEQQSCSSKVLQQQQQAPEKCYYYGAISDKIGEAVVCWICRWAPDILTMEDRMERPILSPDFAFPVRPRSHTLPSTPNSQSSSSVRLAQSKVPPIWRRGGLTAEWICALISSDNLFVKGERQRYDFARSVVELRRSEGIDAAEEVHWEKMFSEGIYYTNMIMEDLIAISQDVSPTTLLPYVSMPVLQAALWDQAILRNHIVPRPGTGSSPVSTPPLREKEIGIATTTAQILSDLKPNSLFTKPSASYYPIPSDSSCRLGEAGKIEGTSMDDIFESLSSPQSSASQSSAKAPRPSERTFFGIKSNRQTAASCISSDAVGNDRWSPYPPFRFAIEFWDAEHLKEKSRLHSHTVWYAGSLFNVYVQVVRKKGIQLGVYLHRQSSVDTIPPTSSPTTANSTFRPFLPKFGTHSTISPSSSLPSTLHYSPSINSPLRSTTPGAGTSSPVPGSPQTVSSLPPSSFPLVVPSTTPIQPYRDPRSAVSVYFSINVASAYGTSLTKFTSAPDVFSISQSWGWKSSSTRTEEYLDIGKDGGTNDYSSTKDVSLRATIVLGVI